MAGNQQFLLILLNTGVCFLLARRDRSASRRRERQRMLTQWGLGGDGGVQNVSSCFWPDGNSSSLQSKAYLRAIRSSQKGCVCFKAQSVLFFSWGATVPTDSKPHKSTLKSQKRHSFHIFMCPSSHASMRCWDI